MDDTLHHPYPTWAEIDLDALSHNLGQVKKLVGGKSQIMAVIKADAYGHGAVPVARRLLQEGAHALGVAFVEEALQLRRAGISAPLVLLSGAIGPQEFHQVVKEGLQPFVYSPRTLRTLSQLAAAGGRKVKVHLKVDTGMGRLGVAPEEALEFVRLIHSLPGLQLAGLASHFARAEDDPKTTLEQLERFRRAAEEIKRAGFNIPSLHLANSAAVINYPGSRYDLVRPGIMLYGAVPPSELPPDLSLRPVLSLKSKIIHLKKVAPGTSISYGHTYTAPVESLIGTISIGYADGFSRLLSNRGEVLVHGRRVPVRGRVCMDLIMVDLTPLRRVKTGDTATIIGRDGTEEISACEAASRISSISYEVLCLIGKRVKRVYTSDKQVLDRGKQPRPLSP